MYRMFSYVDSLVCDSVRVHSERGPVSTGVGGYWQIETVTGIVSVEKTAAYNLKQSPGGLILKGK